MEKMTERVKRRLNEGRAEAKETIMNLRAGVLPRLKMGDKILYGFVGILSVFLYQTGTASAAGGTILDSIATLINTYYEPIKKILIGAGALCLLLALGMWLLFPSERGSEKGKAWFVRIIYCLVGIVSVGGIIALINTIGEKQTAVPQIQLGNIG